MCCKGVCISRGRLHFRQVAGSGWIRKAKNNYRGVAFLGRSLCLAVGHKRHHISLCTPIRPYPFHLRTKESYVAFSYGDDEYSTTYNFTICTLRFWTRIPVHNLLLHNELMTMATGSPM